ncbi:hypothetical protein GF402_10415 [Candidatus Fermentibacteria bacterium]|nr:hypothetical protein [Candidatus Fermentibacteria bacterium]
MEHFKDQEGTFVFEGGRSADMTNRILVIAGIAGVILAAVMTYVMSHHIPERETAELGGFIPYVPLLTLPAMIMALLVVRKSVKSSSRVSVDYTTGRVEFPSVSSRGRRKTTVGKDMIRKIVMTRKQGYEMGRMSSSMLWMVRILTTDGEHDVFATADQAKARGFAGELASLVSRPLIDLTSEEG